MSLAQMLMQKAVPTHRLTWTMEPTRWSMAWKGIRWPHLVAPYRGPGQGSEATQGPHPPSCGHLVWAPKVNPDHEGLCTDERGVCRSSEGFFMDDRAVHRSKEGTCMDRKVACRSYEGSCRDKGAVHGEEGSCMEERVMHGSDEGSSMDDRAVHEKDGASMDERIGHGNNMVSFMNERVRHGDDNRSCMDEKAREHAYDLCERFVWLCLYILFEHSVWGHGHERERENGGVA
ncbi:hypothetical protein AMTRI_Chr07g30220 [Amborella trichopoda]